MKVVVTGAAGMIGANLVHGLNAIGIDDVIAVDDLTDGPKYRNLLGAQIADYFDKSDFYARFARGEFGRIDAVLHEGACSDTMEHDGRFMLDTNYRCSKDLLDACQAQGARLLYASSAATYGGQRVRSAKSPRSSGRSTSTATPSCCSTTSCGACWLRPQLRSPAFATSTSTVRTSSTRAAWHRVAFHHYHQLRETGKVRLFGEYGGYAPGEQRRDFVYVDDVVAVNLWFLEHPEQSGIFNLGTGRAQPFNDVAVATVNAARALQGEAALPLAELVSRGFIEYIPFPDALVGKYQCQPRPIWRACAPPDAHIASPMWQAASPPTWAGSPRADSSLGWERLAGGPWWRCSGRPRFRRIRSRARMSQALQLPTEHSMKTFIKILLSSFLALGTALAFAAAVDVNKASQAELESVKGIGPAMSTRILDARKERRVQGLVRSGRPRQGHRRRQRGEVLGRRHDGQRRVVHGRIARGRHGRQGGRRSARAQVSRVERPRAVNGVRLRVVMWRPGRMRSRTPASLPTSRSPPGLPMLKKFLATLLALFFAAAAFAAVDANTATQAELEGVKGIGPALSTKIIDERKKGAFKDWQDMVTRVSGVGEKNSAKFSTGGLTVNGAPFAGAPAAPAATKTAAAKTGTVKAAPAAMPASAAPMVAPAPAPAASTAAEKKAAAKQVKEDKKPKRPPRRQRRPRARLTPRLTPRPRPRRPPRHRSRPSSTTAGLPAARRERPAPAGRRHFGGAFGVQPKNAATSSRRASVSAWPRATSSCV